MELHPLAEGLKTGRAVFGCLWDEGTCKPGAGFLCVNDRGGRVPVQSRITAYWPDGSVKWTAHSGSRARMGNKIEVTAAEREPEFPEEKKITLITAGAGYTVDNGVWTMDIPGPGTDLFTTVRKGEKPLAEKGRPELILEEPAEVNGCPARVEKKYHGRIDTVEIEERGDWQVTVKYTGTHGNDAGETRLPFIIRMRIGAGEDRIHFTHTFLYDGDENRDFLRGIGIVFDAPMAGEMYNRHLKFAGDHGVFHEAMVGLTSWRPKIPREVYERQMAGNLIREEGETGDKISRMMRDVPFWDTYEICQDYAEHYAIRKKLSLENGCFIDCEHGRRGKGVLAFGGEGGSVLCAIRDFWEKYPSGYTVSGLSGEKVTCGMWFRHPAARPMDFRHYADRGYNQVCYEGYDYKGADPRGIACTGECVLAFSDSLIPEDGALTDLGREIGETNLYVASPAWYHEHHAFGYYSLPKRDTETEKWLEDQLDKAFDFYRDEVEQRGWYGLFNYGDFMHTYDPTRHQWKYDMGGYAWDNTELVPTLWLWTFFLRTGRQDVFRLAEKLTRHASEVDVYHFGKYKGLGSRHNVRHWGCPCKEARIAMAHHHRYYYYLTGDFRLEDLFAELKDNESSFLNKDPLGDFYDKKDMVYPSHARSGPDWSSLCSNWMVQWERTGDTAYRDKMLVGIGDLKAAPLRLISGPDFEFDPATRHLRYIGERTTGGTHLQICMGAPTIWTDMADLLKDKEWWEMLAEYGRFYFLPEDEKQKESGGLIGSREFSLPFMAAAMGALGAWYYKDEATAERVWAVLLNALLTDSAGTCFEPVILPDRGNKEALRELPWISTNFAAQFGLNTVMCLEWIREALPPTVDGAKALAAKTREILKKARLV